MNSEEQEQFLKKNKIMGQDETYDEMCERVFGTIAEQSKKYNVSDTEMNNFKNKIRVYFSEGLIVPSTPILTNAGKFHDRPLTACSVPPLNKRMTRAELEKLVNQYHKKGMGTGFNFDDAEDPVSELLFFNASAAAEFKRKEMDRPVGNMGILSIDHPNVLEFAGVKAGKFKDIDWKFNISINMKDDYMCALFEGRKYKMKDGTSKDSSKLLETIVGYANSCGDPGLVFLDRFEQFNVTPHLGKYVSLAPCGEVPMANGETCQFSYINLGKFVINGQVNYDSLRETTRSVVLMLDNALDISIANIDNSTSAEIMAKKRKIGVGVCGFSDMLFSLGLPYNTQNARNIAEDVMSFINYESKIASVELAKIRGAFPAFYDAETKVDLITDRYIDKPSRTVLSEEWKYLKKQIETYGIRHVTTNALPPTGRSSMVIGASPSIEPAFILNRTPAFDEVIKINSMQAGYNGNLFNALLDIEKYGSCQQTDLPETVKEIYKTCIELSSESHLLMVAAFQKYTDDSISKTINLPHSATLKEIMETYMSSYRLGLKGITVFRDGCKSEQPMLLRNAMGAGK